MINFIVSYVPIVVLILVFAIVLFLNGEENQWKGMKFEHKDIKLVHVSYVKNPDLVEGKYNKSKSVERDG